jgi:hypothetical protein
VIGWDASPSFDINKDGQQFVTVVLESLWMNDEQLGFDPTILTSDGKRYIELVRNGQRERLIIDKLISKSDTGMRYAEVFTDAPIDKCILRLVVCNPRVAIDCQYPVFNRMCFFMISPFGYLGVNRDLHYHGLGV